MLSHQSHQHVQTDANRQIDLVQNDDLRTPGGGMKQFLKPSGYTGDKPSVFFRIPWPADAVVEEFKRGVRHVCTPPHTFRECADGSLEIRASIGVPGGAVGGNYWWHGWLDEGNVWRT